MDLLLPLPFCRFGPLFIAQKNYYLLINGLLATLTELEKQRCVLEAHLKKVRFVLPMREILVEPCLF